MVLPIRVLVCVLLIVGAGAPALPPQPPTFSRGLPNRGLAGDCSSHSCRSGPQMWNDDRALIKTCYSRRPHGGCDIALVLLPLNR